MGYIFLTTILNCNQIMGVLTRLQNIALLTPQQRLEIVTELKTVVPSCPVIIRPNDPKTKAGN